MLINNIYNLFGWMPPQLLALSGAVVSVFVVILIIKVVVLIMDLIPFV